MSSYATEQDFLDLFGDKEAAELCDKSGVVTSSIMADSVCNAMSAIDENNIVWSPEDLTTWQETANITFASADDFWLNNVPMQRVNSSASGVVYHRAKQAATGNNTLVPPNKKFYFSAFFKPGECTKLGFFAGTDIGGTNLRMTFDADTLTAQVWEGSFNGYEEIRDGVYRVSGHFTQGATKANGIYMVAIGDAKSPTEEVPIGYGAWIGGVQFTQSNELKDYKPLTPCDISSYTTDQVAAGVAAASRLRRSIADASDMINSYLAGKYPLPITVSVPLLTRSACDIARYYLYDDRAPDTVAEKYKQQERWLKEIASGRATLGLDTEPDESSDSVQVAAADSVLRFSDLSGY